MSVRIQFTALRAGVKHIPAPQITAALTAYNEKFVQTIVDKTKPYPPVPAGSWYVRTGHLYRSWKVRPRIAGDAISFEALNPVQDPRGRYYSGYVHGPTYQWTWHRRHGWRNIGDVVQEVGGHTAFRIGAQQIITKMTGAI